MAQQTVSSFTTTTADTVATTLVPCFVCHGRNYTADDGEYFMRIFEPDADAATDADDAGETKVSQLLSTLLGRPLTLATVHSPLLCRPCAQLCDEYAQLLHRLEAIRMCIVESYNETIDAYCAAVGEADETTSLAEEQQQQPPLRDPPPDALVLDANEFVLINDANDVTDRHRILVQVNVDGVLGVDRVDAPTTASHEPHHHFSVDDLIEFDATGGAADQHDDVDVSHHSNLYDGASMRPIFLRDGPHFLCQLCDDDTPPIVRSSEQIGAHLRDVHAELVHICDLCGSDHRHSAELIEHLRSHAADALAADERLVRVGGGQDACVDDDAGLDEAEYELNDDDEDDEDIDDNDLLPLANPKPQPTAGSRSLTCAVCSHVAATAAALRQHKRRHYASAQRRFDCAACPKRFKSRRLLEEHGNTHTGDRPHQCPHCPKAFGSKYTLTAHAKIHAADRRRAFACAECPKRFYTQRNLQHHGRTHTGVRQFECAECGKRFATAHNLAVHRIVHTGARPFECGECGKAFARRAEIRDHERTHTGERPFGCDECGATFAQRSNLTSHRRATHLQDKRYKCGECEKSFKRRRLLDYHVQAAHTGERPYGCGVCAARFVYPEHYKKHMRIHSGVKPFACEVCGKAFNSRDNRNAHRFVHSYKKPYECVVCGQGFMRKPLLLAHMKVRQHESKRIVVNRPRVAGAGGTRGNRQDGNVVEEEEEEEDDDEVYADAEEEAAHLEQEVVDLEDGELEEYVLMEGELDDDEDEEEEEEDADADDDFGDEQQSGGGRTTRKEDGGASNVVFVRRNDEAHRVVEFDDIIFDAPGEDDESEV